MKSIVVLLSLFCLCQGSGCPKRWIRSTDRCYYISGNRDTFHGASYYCTDRKSQLAPDLTCEAHVNLVEVLASYRAKCPKGQNCFEFWIGIKELTPTNWKTGNDLLIERKRQHQQWADEYPKGNGTCGIMSLKGTLKRGTWKNVDCTSRFKYVCITCPDGFDYIPEINECLYFNRKKANWSDAQKNCGKMKKGSHLLTIHDSKKQKAVENYLRPQLNGTKMIWMGGQTEIPLECKTPFVWKPGGVPHIPFTYTNWYPGEPVCALSGGNCILLATSEAYNFRWRELRCTANASSVCQF